MPGQSWSVKRLLTLSVLLCAGTVHGGDPERVSIHVLLSPQATSYQRHAVTIEGLTSDLQTLSPSVGTYSPSRPALCPLYGRASFMVEDDTGMLPVDVLGSCNPNAFAALPKEGDRVRITGLVHVLKTEAPRHVRIQAMTIQILESTP